MILAVAGCVAQAEGAEILARAPYVDIVLGPQTYHRLPEMVAQAGARRRPCAPDRLSRRGEVRPFAGRRPAARRLGLPLGAGGLRQVLHLLRRALYAGRRVLAAGRSRARRGAGARRAGRARDHAAWARTSTPIMARAGDGTWGLARAHPRARRDRWACGGSATPPRIPLDMDDALIAAHRDVPALMPFLHLPVQSGSDTVLAAMNRRHGADDYRRMVERLRRARPDIALSSDFIVGFPGESEADFARHARAGRRGRLRPGLLVQIQRAAGHAGGAPARPSAGRGEGRAPRAPAGAFGRRTAPLQRHGVGRTMPVLFEKRGRHPGQLVGRSPYLQPVHAPAPARLLGAVVRRCRSPRRCRTASAARRSRGRPASAGVHERRRQMAPRRVADAVRRQLAPAAALRRARPSIWTASSASSASPSSRAATASRSRRPRRASTGARGAGRRSTTG